MRNYNREIEAAYLASRRQGDEMRNPRVERSPHQDRRNADRSEKELYESGFNSMGDRYQLERRSSPVEREGQERGGQASHRGKGPRNYKRSDQRIKENVCDMFCDDPYLDASDIEVEVKDSEVILTGAVEDRYAKRRAEDIAEDISGVAHVENRIRVNQDKKQDRRERVNQEIV
jgi:osmotically-inducible protein OsmY